MWRGGFVIFKSKTDCARESTYIQLVVNVQNLILHLYNGMHAICRGVATQPGLPELKKVCAQKTHIGHKKLYP